MARHFLYLTNPRMVSLVTRGLRIVARRDFEVSSAGLAEFESHVAGLASAPTHLVSDLAEEDFRSDTVPHVSAGDRAAIVGRKLGQIFRNTPYRHALLQGREAEGRRDDRVLYAAITNPDALRPWLEVMERLEIPLAGVHSAAVLGARLAQALDLAHAHTMLVLITPGGALRQTYLRAGEMRFTRLTPIDLQEGQTLGMFIAEETTRTWQYLDNQRFFGPDERLEVYILAHPRDHETITPAMQGFGQLGYHVLDSDEVAARVGLKPPPHPSSAEEFLIHLYLRRPLENHFASPEMRRYWVIRGARSALNGTSVGILLLGLVIGGMNLARIVSTTDVDQRNARSTLQLSQAYDQIARAMPNLGIGGTAMRDAVTFYASHIQDFPKMGSFLVELSRVLETHPGVRLNQLAWQATDDPKTVPAMTLQAPRSPPPVKALAKGADMAARAAPDDGPNTPFAGGRYEVALVEASVSVPSHDFRAALAEVERLVADIGGLRGFQAQIVESPLDVRPSLALQGRHAEREPGSMSTRFVLRIVRTREAAA